MPREQINYPDLAQKQREIETRADHNRLGVKDGELISTGDPWTDITVHVAWMGNEAALDGAHHGWVQVAFEADLDYLKLVVDTPNGSRPDSTLLWSPSLNPGDIDRLIATLKRAKRKAFYSGVQHA